MLLDAGLTTCKTCTRKTEKKKKRTKGRRHIDLPLLILWVWIYDTFWSSFGHKEGLNEKKTDNSEIRTHAPFETTILVKPERSALDRSAMLPWLLLECHSICNLY